MKIDILGVKIDNLTKHEVLQDIETRLNQNQFIFIVTPYSESIVAAQKDAEFRNVLNSADIALPDGIGILWAAKFLSLKAISYKLKALWQLFYSLLAVIFNPSYIRHPIPEKISGAEFIWDLARLAAENNYSIFLLGGFGDTPERAAQALKSKFPTLRIAGIDNSTLLPSPASAGEGGTRNREGEGNLVEKINSSRADFLFVALGPIRQEKWIYENLPKLGVNPVTAPDDTDGNKAKAGLANKSRSNGVKLAIGLGGTFDYLAQKRPYRPKIWAARGLEWLWRLLTQPRRMARILKGIFGLIFYCYRSKL